MEISNNKNIKILQPTGNIAERLLEYHNKVMIEASKLREDSFNQSQNKLRQHTFCKSFPPPPYRSILHQDYAADKLLTHNMDIGGGGILTELSLSFLRENPDKFCCIELSQNLLTV